MSVHPDHAALIAEARNMEAALHRVGAKGPDYEYASSGLGDLLRRVTDALASVPSPRTPLPQEAERCDCGSLTGEPHIPAICGIGAPRDTTFELREDIREIVRMATFDGCCDKSVRNEVYAKLDAINAALAAAPKVEQRTPTREAVEEALRPYAIGRDRDEDRRNAVDRIMAAFTSPEAPEPEGT